MYHHTTKTLSSGCSFTSGNWEKHFNTYYKHYDSALPGAGNRYIADSIIHLTSQDHYDCVFVMWSGLTRLDIPLTDWSLVDDYLYLSPQGQTPADTRYLLSGGSIGSWWNHPVARSVFSGTYRVSDFNTLALTSLLEIIKLQEYLKSKNIPYYFMSYMNFWSQPAEWVSPNGDQGLNNFSNLAHLINQIDFNSWIFSNDKKDGLFELATEMEDLLDDNFHPGELANIKWFEIIRDRIIRDQILD